MSFNGKVIYNPSGKAGEYSYWAANFYNGCSARCEYCYNRKGVVAKVLGGDVPTLKKSLGIEKIALDIFRKELYQNLNELRKHGLFFNFVSDPCLPETFELNKDAWDLCYETIVPIKVLTKQAWWVKDFLSEPYLHPEAFAFGFTLTGHDELEPGAATNIERIEAMKNLHDAGFKTWASIEPIIDFHASADMIYKVNGFCDLYKIGLQSGKKYNKQDALEFIEWVNEYIPQPVYFKDSILDFLSMSRESLPSNCVDRTFNL